MTYVEKDMCSNKIVPSRRKKKFSCTENFNVYKMLNILEQNVDFDSFDSLDFLKINAYEYRKGIMLILDENIMQIEEILEAEKKFVLVCSKYKLNYYDNDLNSINIEKVENDYELVTSIDKIPKPYEKKNIKNNAFIIADTLDVYKESSV